VEISRAAERDADGSPMKLQVGPYEIAMQRPATADRAAEADAFFAALAGIKPGERHSWWDRPLLLWTEAPRPVRSLADGSPVGGDVAVSLNATPRTVRRHLFSSSAEFDAKVWGALLALAFLLFDVFVVATLMAMVMIFTLSRAFNRLSRATAAVATGNFGVRIPVKRNDQVGALQRSFNDMAEHLEELVEANAGKELIEKELAIARDLQQSLLPRNLPAGDSVEFSLLFAPSAAIGGDYFDVFHLGEGRLAVVVADVSGHGLPTGLRMAMVKAALTILVEEGKSPEEILRRLDAVVRADDDRRLFVTATLARVDLEAGTVEITNAGHPPTYLVRGGEVEEISLPGSPLGGLDQRYGQREVGLEPGDVVVWLSDGLIEATDRRSDAFGYEGVKQALGAGPATTAAMVRDRLLAAVETHTQGRPIEDDRTVVVMRYIGRPSATAGAAAGAGSHGGVRGSL
jgi:sigma-B regulation protein RsbU (phosphoserine phosphatase)